MSAKLLLRLAAGALAFFAVGHTFGHFSFHQVTDPKARQVQQAMIENKFDMFGSLRSYDENYTGMSLILIFVLVAFIAIFWIASYAADANRRLVAKMLIPVALCLLCVSVAGFVYFFPGPGTTSLVAAVLTSLAIAKLNRPVKLKGLSYHDKTLPGNR